MDFLKRQFVEARMHRDLREIAQLSGTEKIVGSGSMMFDAARFGRE
jgi:hypothetical protein